MKKLKKNFSQKNFSHPRNKVHNKGFNKLKVKSATTARIRGITQRSVNQNKEEKEGLMLIMLQNMKLLRRMHPRKMRQGRNINLSHPFLDLSPQV